MKSRIAFFVLCIFTGTLIGLALAATVDKGPEVIKIDINKSGKSVPASNHKKHQEMKDLKDNCLKCHHKSKPGETPQKCSVCHTDIKNKDPKTNAPGFQSAAHKLCQECHKNQKDKPELKAFKTCHGK